MIANLILVAALNGASMLQAADLPRCSATVTDECMEGAAPAHHRGKAVHHRAKRPHKAK